jgi:hypothetical protein
MSSLVLPSGGEPEGQGDTVLTAKSNELNTPQLPICLCDE